VASQYSSYGLNSDENFTASTDISAFVACGGKLLIAHGLQDVLVSTGASEMYWEKLQGQSGRRSTGLPGSTRSLGPVMPSLPRLPLAGTRSPRLKTG